MRSIRKCAVGCVLLYALPTWSQQSPSNTASARASQDPQAISILNQSLAVAGGVAALASISDYTATGSIMYHWTEDVQGTATVRGMGSDNFRIDATLPAGVRSESIQNGQATLKSPDGKLSQLPRAYAIPSTEAIPYKEPMLPSSLALPDLQVAAVLANSRMALSYKGIVQIDGRSAHQIESTRYSPGGRADAMTEYFVWDFFIDTSTLQLVMVRDIVPVHAIHEIRYSSYQVASGVLVPFSITEQIGGQHTWDLHIAQISFNTGLQDSDFVVQ